jgi:hypothetical protein
MKSLRINKVSLEIETLSFLKILKRNRCLIVEGQRRVPFQFYNFGNFSLLITTGIREYPSLRCKKNEPFSFNAKLKTLYRIEIVYF